MGIAVAMLAGWVSATQAVQARTSTFPAALEREVLLVWLQRETDILPSQVVAVTPQAITAIVSNFPAGDGPGPRLVIRAEALSAEVFARTGAMSWHVSLNADCQNRRVRLGETTGYSERNLLGARSVLREAEVGWRAPEPGTALEHAWRAACDSTFTGPFRSASVKLAQADATPTQAVAEAVPVVQTARTSSPAAATPPATPAKAAAPAKPPPAVRAPSAGVPRLSVQLGAMASDPAARSLLIGLSARLQGLPTWVERADMEGRVWHRAMAGGFADAAEAARFCANLKAAGVSCFVRNGRAG